jgi:type I restriction enzyme, S subunit
LNTISLLDSVSEIIDNRGKTCPTSEHGIALIATNCVKSSNLFPTKERIRFVNQHTYDNWFRGHPQPGDILFVNKGSPGEVCLVPDNIDFCFAQDMVALRANKEKIDPLYLFAVLRSKRIKDTIHNMYVGTMIPHFKKGDFKKIYLPLPNRQIQEFIGNYYYSCSKKIHLNQKTNQTLEEIAKTLFKSWFIDFDPVKSKLEGVPTGLSKEISDLFPNSFEESELGNIPKSWKITNLNDVTSKFTTGLNPRKNFVLGSGENFYVTIKNLGDFGVILDDKCDKVDSEAIKRINTRSNLNKGDILFSGIGTIGKVVYVFDEPKNWNISESVFSMRANPEVTYPSFLYQLLKSYPFQSYAKSLAVGSVQKGVRMGSLKAYKVSLSNFEVQNKFNEIISPMIKKISINLKEIKNLVATRDMLLPKLISGELRILDAEKIAQENSV